MAPIPPPKENAPTEAEIRKIMREDSATFGESNCNWVRRSSRQPSKSVLNSAGVRDLLDKLKSNDSDMVVLKMKKYINDPDVPPVIMDAALDALEENTNCQALYIQVSTHEHLDNWQTILTVAHKFPLFTSIAYLCLVRARTHTYRTSTMRC